MRTSLFKIATVILLVAAGLACGRANAQETASRLKFSFATGQKLSVTQEEVSDDLEENMLEGTQHQSSSTRRITQLWDVVSVTSAGEATIDVKYSGIYFKQNPAPGVAIVLDTSRSTAEVNPILNQLGPQGAMVLEQFETIRKLISEVFVDRAFRMVVSDSGNVKSVSGFDAAWETYRAKVGPLVPDKAKRAQLDALIEAFFGEEAVHKLFSYTLFVSLPVQPVMPGKEWSDSMDFTLQSIHIPVRRTFKLTSVSDAGKTARIEGKLIFGDPTATEEIEFKLPSYTIGSDISLDPLGGTLLKQTYSGKLTFEAYGRQPANNRMILRSVSDIKGSVLISVASK